MSSESPLPPNVSANDQAMMRVALEYAEMASLIGEVPVGAVVYNQTQVLAVAHNLRESTEDPTAHAEILALREASLKTGSWRLVDCTLVVTLEPCPMCAGALVNARIPRLIYGAADPKMGAVDSLYQLCTDHRFNHRIDVTPGLFAQQSAKLLKDFFRERRGKKNEEDGGKDPEVEDAEDAET